MLLSDELIDFFAVAFKLAVQQIKSLDTKCIKAFSIRSVHMILSVFAEIRKTERCGSLIVFASLNAGKYKNHHGHNVGNKLQELLFC